MSLFKGSSLAQLEYVAKHKFRVAAGLGLLVSGALSLKLYFLADRFTSLVVKER
jgi:hypothetical protein